MADKQRETGKVRPKPILAGLGDKPLALGEVVPIEVRSAEAGSVVVRGHLPAHQKPPAPPAPPAATAATPPVAKKTKG
jgi:hypothetical protein